MLRPFKAGNSNIVGWLAVLLSIGFIILFFPGMPAALIWPYEWVIFAGWWVIGGLLIYLKRETYMKSSKDISSSKTM